MTEREKMLAGELYDAQDPGLVEMRARARRLTHRFNTADPDDRATRDKALADLLGTCARGVFIEPAFRCDYGVHTHLGERVFMNFGCVVLDCAQVRIGSGTMLGPSVQLYTATHPLQASERMKGPELARPITIGRDCWIGGGAIVCPGVTIGDGTTIGAGSVVTRDVPGGVFAAGNPCRVIREL
ncbi:MAG: sugar O-acetyltransferase [Phycisphaerales bacterium JB040]